MDYQTGKINYFFKGMSMQSESVRVIEHIPKKTLVVLRCCDEQIFEFKYIFNKWLLKGHETSASVLYGTQFVFNE